MNIMIFKHYCAVFFNPTDGLSLEVAKVSEGKPRVIPGRNISIFTFTSVVETPILTDYFKSFNRNFLLFDLNQEVSGFNFVDKQKEEDLFGFLDNDKSNKNFESLSNMLLDDFIKHTLDISDVTPEFGSSFSGGEMFNTYQEIKIEKEETPVEIDENMTNTEINAEIDRIIDKGVENLTDRDKKMLQKLSSLR
jgi:hypothetical protein